MAGCSEHGNELTGSIQCRGYTDKQLNHLSLDDAALLSSSYARSGEGERKMLHVT